MAEHKYSYIFLQMAGGVAETVVADDIMPKITHNFKKPISMVVY